MQSTQLSTEKRRRNLLLFYGFRMVCWNTPHVTGSRSSNRSAYCRPRLRRHGREPGGMAILPCTTTATTAVSTTRERVCGSQAGEKNTTVADQVAVETVHSDPSLSLSNRSFFYKKVQPKKNILTWKLQVIRQVFSMEAATSSWPLKRRIFFFLCVSTVCAASNRCRALSKLRKRRGWWWSRSVDQFSPTEILKGTFFSSFFSVAIGVSRWAASVSPFVLVLHWTQELLLFFFFYLYYYFLWWGRSQFFLVGFLCCCLLCCPAWPHPPLARPFPSSKTCEFPVELLSAPLLKREFSFLIFLDDWCVSRRHEGHLLLNKKKKKKSLRNPTIAGCRWGWTRPLRRWVSSRGTRRRAELWPSPSSTASSAVTEPLVNSSSFIKICRTVYKVTTWRWM